MLLHQNINRFTSPILAFSNVTVLLFWPTICMQVAKSLAITKIKPDEYQTSSIKFLFHHIFGVYVASPSSTLSFRIFLSSIHLRERKNDSRFVAETSSAWVHSLIHLSKIENKNFLRKNRYIGAQPIRETPSERTKNCRSLKILKKLSKTEEVSQRRESWMRKWIWIF